MTRRLRCAAALLCAAACGGAGGQEGSPAEGDTTRTTTTLGSSSTTSAPSTTVTTTTAIATTAPPSSSPPATPPTDPPPAPPPFASSVATITADDVAASWHEGCPVAVEQLRLLTLTHWGFDGAVHTGRLVVHADHADTVVAVFADLYAVGFPIERMEPIDAYGGDDDASMAANNTSAFNCRPVTGGSSWSEHAYGTAIDINPVQNPYVKGPTVLPEAGRVYVDRREPEPGKIRAGDDVVDAFSARGWGWGGYWSALKDYQHFSASGR